MRVIAWVVGLALLGGVVAGCKQQCFLTECDLQCANKIASDRLEFDANVSHELPPPSGGEPPPTIDHPEREARYVTLAECIALALENGTVGFQQQQSAGVPVDTLVSFQGRGVGGDDAIRVLALDPAIIGADIEASLAKFDARFVGALQWNTTDQPIGTALQAFQASSSSLQAIESQDATASFTLIKPLPTGGVAGITFRTDYQFTNLPARVNPSYRPTLQFQFEQPLLQGFGVEINQLRATHPGSTLTPFQTGGRVEGILITRLRFDQQRAEFERQLHFLLLNVETAYWNLYATYWNLYSREQALRQAYEAWKINYAKLRAGRVSLGDAAQSRGQYELFRSQRLTALGQVLESERRLRALAGLPVSDANRIVPADTPTLAPYRPDWHQARQEALALRPELILAREDLKFRQLDLINQKNLLLPDVRFTSTYDYNGIGTRLDGSGQQNALRSLATGQFSNIQIGLRADIPLGFRDANSAVRVARLNLERSYRVLKDQELKAERVLEQQYRQIFEFYAQIQAVRSQRQAFAEQLQARFQGFIAGRDTLDVLLEAQRFWADALANEHNFIAQYNNALAGFEFAKGTIMQHDNVVIGEGALPKCVQIRAVEHERERSRSLVFRERANPVPHPKCAYDEGQVGLPQLPAEKAVALPAVLSAAPPVANDAQPLPPISALPDLPAEAKDRLNAPTGGGLQSVQPAKAPGARPTLTPITTPGATPLNASPALPLPAAPKGPAVSAVPAAVRSSIPPAPKLPPPVEAVKYPAVTPVSSAPARSSIPPAPKLPPPPADWKLPQ